jgi:diguanylate cyclase
MRADRRGQPAVARFAAMDAERSWCREALELGLLSCISFPIRDNGDVFGALTIFTGSSTSFDSAERAQLEELALDLGYGIMTLRTRVARQESEARVTHLNAVLRGIRNVNQLITRERDPQRLIEEVCELMVESAAAHGLPAQILAHRAAAARRSRRGSRGPGRGWSRSARRACWPRSRTD